MLQAAQAASSELSPEQQALFDESQDQMQRYAAAAEHSAAEADNLRGEIEGLQKELEEAQVYSPGKALSSQGIILAW